MKGTRTAASLSLALLICFTASAQRATEVYIPIGESPGVSDSESESVIGTITDVEYEQHRMAVSTEGTTRTVTITSETRFYVDKSGDRERNFVASFDECREGRRIEAYVDESGNAFWIKIAVN